MSRCKAWSLQKLPPRKNTLQKLPSTEKSPRNSPCGKLSPKKFSLPSRIKSSRGKFSPVENSSRIKKMSSQRENMTNENNEENKEFRILYLFQFPVEWEFLWQLFQCKVVWKKNKAIHPNNKYLSILSNNKYHT